MANILIAEDEKSINNLIRMNLSLVGHTCTQVFDGAEALRRAADTRFDLVILDVMLPKLSGFEIIGRLEKTPTIFVTAKGGLSDRLTGLRLGADDYITKPFEILELVARVDAVLRRTARVSSEIKLDALCIDLASKTVTKDGAEIPLKPKEFELLDMLLRNRNLALSREQLIEAVWGYDFEGDVRTVDVHVQKLRQKLGLGNRLKTVYKLGYRLEFKDETEGRG